MRVITEFQEKFSREDADVIDRVVNSSKDQFDSLVDTLGMNPKRSLRYADFSGCDFSNADVRGYDFTGSDLRNCIGHNVKWDSTTKLAGARTDDSIFHARRTLDEFIQSNEVYNKLYKQRQSAYWADNSIWIARRLRREDPDHEGILKVVMRLFFDLKSDVVRSDILYHSRRAVRDLDEYKSFLLSVSSLEVSSNVTVTIITIISNLFVSDEAIFKTLMFYIVHSDFRVRAAAVKGVTRSTFFDSRKEEVRSVLEKEESQVVRGSYMRAVFAKTSTALAAGKNAKSFLVDYDRSVTYSTIIKFVDKWLDSNPRVDPPWIERIQMFYRDLLLLRDQGIPYVFDTDIDKYISAELSKKQKK